MKRLARFESLQGSDWVIHEHSRIFAVEKTKGDSSRLCITVSDGGAKLLEQLCEPLSEPFFILYVLVVPRGGSKEGRYQSPEMNHAQVADFFSNNAKFFDEDGRHHVWLHSKKDNSTLIYDRHNVVYAYGLIEKFLKILASCGYAKVDCLQFPDPHAHQYHQEFDEKERELVATDDWVYSPLRNGDEI